MKPNPIPSLNTLYLSFYSKDLYRDVARNGKGLCLGYLFFLLLIYWVPEMMNLHRNYAGFIEDEAPKYVEQVPEITIAKGEASIREPVPYLIHDRKNNILTAIIDTSDQITSLKDSPAVVLLTKKALIIKKDEEMRSIPLTGFGDMTITKKVIYTWLEVFNTLFVVIIFPFVLLVSFGFHIIQVILLALLGGNIAKYFNVSLDFRALIRISAVAFTPAILLETVHAMLQIDYPYSTFFSFLITAGYLLYAVGANAEKGLTPIRK